MSELPSGLGPLPSLLAEMYAGHGVSDAVRIAYFERFEPRLARFDFVELCRCQMATYPHRYVLDFVLATPFLWRDLEPEAWLRLLVAPRPPLPDGRDPTWHRSRRVRPPEPSWRAPDEGARRKTRIHRG